MNTEYDKGWAHRMRHRQPKQVEAHTSSIRKELFPPRQEETLMAERLRAAIGSLDVKDGLKK